MILSFCCLASCSVHQVDEQVAPLVSVSEAFTEARTGGKEIQHWWEEYGDESLNQLVCHAIQENLGVRQAWSRLAQARAAATIAAAARWPQVNAQGSVTDTNVDSSGSSFSTTATRWLLSGTVSYEVDLWRRIDSVVKAAEWSAEAAEGDAEATALMVSATAADLWLTIQEQRELLQVLDDQLEVNRTLLELLELRYTVSVATVLDVYQQRQIVASTEAQIPQVEKVLRTAEQTLAVLLGEDPGPSSGIVPKRPLPDLPPSPDVKDPRCLIENRPDLRAAHAQLLAADYEVGRAIAERLPQLNLSFSYDISTTSLSDLLQQQVRTLTGGLLQPLIDGGRLSAEVDRTRAVVEERLYAFTEAFLNAVFEVENALMLEKQQLELIHRLEKQEQAAIASEREAEERYLNGLNDYLTVIASIQSLQTLQRRMVSERKELLAIRAQLYRALGGAWTDGVEDWQ